MSGQGRSGCLRGMGFGMPAVQQKSNYTATGRDPGRCKQEYHPIDLSVTDPLRNRG